MATWLIVYVAMSLGASAFVAALGAIRAARRARPVPVRAAPQPRFRSTR